MGWSRGVAGKGKGEELGAASVGLKDSMIQELGLPTSQDKCGYEQGLWVSQFQLGWNRILQSAGYDAIWFDSRRKAMLTAHRCA